jgi:hypothetical protein
MRPGAGKRSVHDFRLGNAKTNSWGPIPLDLPLSAIRRSLVTASSSPSSERTCSGRRNVSLWNQPVCAKVFDFNVSQLTPAARRFEQAPHLLHSGNAFSHHEIQWRPSSE